ncbi:hypothetical protein V6Z11_A12G036100 [Gossypium hirsutum]|uniref:Uncharacterized protein n=1 Tax=Gossypium tomentosum TaxID=34277 RepID=A0A5D2MRT8_GOSTO|nr:hypothetical protein ES332_A12G033800v1 [Gossypium tomentosum]
MKVKFINKAIPSVVYPRLMKPQMLQLLIRVLSERLHLWVLIVGQPYYISTNRRHRGRSTTPRNQQHENFVINDSLSLSGSELREMVGTKTSILFVLWIPI